MTDTPVVIDEDDDLDCDDPDCECHDDLEFDENAPDIHIKWIVDGAPSLSDVAAGLRSYADYCEAIEQLGWQLSQPVDNSHGFVEWIGEGPKQYPLYESDDEDQPARLPERSEGH